MSNDIDIKGYASLSANINKQKGEITPDNKEGVVSEKLPELNLEMSDSDLIKLTRKWEKSWNDSVAKQEWLKQIEENEKYWLGIQFDSPKADKTRPMVDNLIFESLETYLPQVTRRNPEPLVTLDPVELDDAGNETETQTNYVHKLKLRLVDLADKNKLRLKLKKGARHWAIYQLGVAKFGWDLDRDIPIVRIVRPKKVILDPDETIDEDGYTGNRIGEYRKLEASKIIDIVGDEGKTKIISDLVKEDLATDIQFIEWWTPAYICWQLGENILLKKKNPHWNYDQNEESKEVDEYGNENASTNEVNGVNHFPSPKMPYVFLSVFNLGDQPMDKTSLIQQNLSNQDLINKRNRQIDKNADDMNGGFVVSQERSGLTQSQAKNVVTAIRKGGAVVIPTGLPREAIDRYPSPGLPGDIFNQLLDTRNRLRDIFGTKGSTPSGIESEKTVRGKIMSRSFDADRIGGGVSEYLEQFSDDIYNWFVQLLYVYDPGFQFLGGAIPPRVNISVKEGSLLPKDSMSIANQSLDLANMNRISTLDLYKRLEFPNPEEMAANVWLEANAPELLYKDNQLVQEAMMLKQQAAMTEMQNKQNRQIEKPEGSGSMLSEVPQSEVMPQT